MFRLLIQTFLTLLIFKKNLSVSICTLNTYNRNLIIDFRYNFIVIQILYSLVLNFQVLEHKLKKCY